MTKDNQSFSQFGKTFQEKLAKLILLDKVFSVQLQEVIDPLFFEQKYLQKWTKLIFDYRDKYEEHPSVDIMKSLVRTELNEDELVKSQVDDYFVRSILSNKIRDAEDLKDSKYIKDKSLDFCKKQVLKEAMIKSIELLNKSSFDEISGTINEALKLGIDTNIGHDYIRDFEERFNIKMRKPITTGWSLIDNATNGGLGRGELGVIMASTGGGKSMFLVHWGAQAVKQGLNVLHFTFELGDESIGLRYDACHTGIQLQKLIHNKERIKREISSIPGKLIIKEYPTKTASINTIRAFLQKLNRINDFKPDMIIVDYADLMKSARRYEQKRNELESIYEDLRALAQENDAAVITASQTNREGFDAKIISISKVAEAWSKCFVSDLIITLARTDEDKVANTGRIHLAKNRNGPDGLTFPIFMDTSRVSIKILKPEEKGETMSIKEQYQEHLKERKRMGK